MKKLVLKGGNSYRYSEDVARIVRIFAERGYKITPHDAELAWGPTFRWLVRFMARPGNPHRRGNLRRGDELFRGERMSFPSRVRNITGERFGRLVAIELTPDRVRNNAVWRFRCDCGNEILRPSGDIIRGNTTSCGCFKDEVKGDFFRENAARFNKARLTHGHTTQNAGRTSSTYSSWLAMRKRCDDPNSKGFANYGARGIKVCARWKNFENFLADMGERPAGTQIDRYPNNDGDYESGNCRWATPKQNSNNRRVCHAIEFRGRTQNIKEWAAELGVSHQSIAYRLKAGWTVEEALTTPNNPGNGWKRGARA